MSSSKRPKGAIVVRSAEAGRLVGFAARGTAEERRQAIKGGLKASKDGQKTSDPDRLRAAADVLDDGGIHGQREWPEDDLCICGLDWDAQHRRDVAAAPLLRAVDQHRIHDAHFEGIACRLCTALALADTILPTPHCCADWECGFVTPPDRDHCKCWEKPFTLGAPCQRQGRKRDGTLSEVGET